MTVKITTDGTYTFSRGGILTHSDLNDTFWQPVLPIGSVIAWLKSLTGVPATLPTGWLECDGTEIVDADSPLNGEDLPDLNGDKKILYGDTTSGSVTEPASLMHTHYEAHSPGTSGDGGADYPFYSVVFIMRVK